MTKTMPLRQPLLVLLALVSATGSRPEARLCVGGRSNEQHLSSSDVVFLGRAKDQRAVPGPRGGTETETTFEIDVQWKGAPQQPVAVRTCGGTGRWCEHAFVFQREKAYLVFASGSPLRTDTCTLTSASETAGPLMAWLNEHKF